MIETYFGLSRRPFLAVPDVNSFFPSETMETARLNVLRCLNRGEGISVIIGQSGIGKTLLLRLLGLPFQLDYEIANISNHRLKSPKAFLQQVLFELHQPYCGSDENELRLLLWDYLRRSAAPGVILLVDEGQSISLSVLEEIRLMLNCDNGTFSRFRVAIAGTVELEERLTHPKLKAFNQWIVSRSYLEPLTKSETSEYILWQTQNARKSDSSGAIQNLSSIHFADTKSDRVYRIDPPHQHSEQFPLFDDSARKKIHKLTGGVPRLINQLCDHALVLACKTNHATIIDEKCVRSAWASLQQIPEPEAAAQTPLSGQTRAKSENVIEFGTLDDDSPCVNEIPEPLAQINEEENNTPPFAQAVAETEAEIFDAPFEELLFLGENDDDEDETDTDLISEEEEAEWDSILITAAESTAKAAPEKPDEHVYQSKSYYEKTYPNGPEQAMSNWIGPGHQVECGVGTPYREILYRNLSKPPQNALRIV